MKVEAGNMAIWPDILVKSMASFKEARDTD